MQAVALWPGEAGHYDSGERIRIPSHLGNTHGPADQVPFRNGAGLRLKLEILFVNEDQTIVHDAVTFPFSFSRIWTAPISAVEVSPADLALLRVEVDEGCNQTSSAPDFGRGVRDAVFGSYRDRTTAQLVCKLVLDEEPSTRIIDPIRPHVPVVAGKLGHDGEIEISVEVDIVRMESGAKIHWLVRRDW
jgi:hypothetical protein